MYVYSVSSGLLSSKMIPITTLTAIIIHPFLSLQYSVPYSELFILYYGQIAQSKGWRSGLSLQLNLKRRSLQHLQAVSPIQPTKLTTDPGSTLFLRRNRKGTPTNHPTTLSPYHLTTSILNPHYQQQPSLLLPNNLPAFGPATLRLLLCLRSPFL
jgi:hypothetical protein